MTTTNQQKINELLEKIFHLQSEIENPDTEYFDRLDAQTELVDVNYEYTELVRQECISEKQHNKMIVSENGYDVCFNCGGKL